MTASTSVFPVFRPVAGGPSVPFVAAPPVAPLGIYAASSSDHSSSVVFDAETGEIRREGWSYGAALVERYALQSQARRAMLERWRRDGQEGKAHKVTRCRRWLRPRPAGVMGPVAPYAEVLKHGGTGKTFYAGTEICGSFCACPPCAVKLSEYRAREIDSAVEQWAADGGICLFVTLTVPHSSQDVLSSVLGWFSVALKRFRSGRAFDALNKSWGRVGLIRAFECTWGELNGWHPHTHELWFVRPDDLRAWALGWLANLGYEPEPGVELDRTALEFAARGALYELWASAAVAAGLSEPSPAHGLDVRVAETQAELRAGLAQYLAKLGRSLPEDGRPLWGVAAEMARAHSKKGRAARKMSPFDFLRAQFDPEISVAQKIRYRELFADFVQAFARKDMTFWSPGLKARFGIVGRTDKETAEESREAADVLARLEAAWWERLFVRADHRATVLLLAQEHGGEVVRRFVAGLPPPDS